MRVLVIGGNGMLGHKLHQVLVDPFDTWVTTRRSVSFPWLGADRVVTPVDAGDVEGVRGALALVKPDVVVNCVGVVKQASAAGSKELLTIANAWFPHQLAQLCTDSGARLIHISTDCVFSGRRGRYTETDPIDPIDLYGASKALGEPSGEAVLTLRTSIIGPELDGDHGLLQWFLAQQGGAVDGYSKAVFSGLPTVTLSKVLVDIIEKHRGLHSLYHVSSNPITKLELLELLKDGFGLDMQIRAVDEPRIDRSLDSRRFQEETGWRPPAWPTLVEELVRDVEAHKKWRVGHGSRG